MAGTVTDVVDGRRPTGRGASREARRGVRRAIACRAMTASPPEPAPRSTAGAVRAGRSVPSALVLAALAGGVLASVGPTLPAAAQPGPPLGQLGLERVVGGLAAPVAVTHAGDGRLFVTLQEGLIVIVRDGERVSLPFFDLRDRVLAGGERGLFSVAFHPRYAQNGRFFVFYTDLGGDAVISRFEVSADPDVARGGSERVLLHIEQPFANHNGGQLAFGPDGYLYAGLGDGGASFDPLCAAQDLESLLGKVLRLDVDANPNLPPHYGIPPDNPFAVQPPLPGFARPEIWAFGLRNPWRFSFDRLRGDLWIGDVGQGTREEIDRQPAASPGGENYGWKAMEGTTCTGRSNGCDDAPPPCGGAEYVLPVLEYPTGSDCAVIGGVVYRGAAIDGLGGTYLFGDFCSGRVWAADAGAASPVAREVPQLRSPGLTSFGEGADGEVYLTAGDSLYRLTGPAPPPDDCVRDDLTLCLGEGYRFRVRASFRVASGPTQQAKVEKLTRDTGYLWFFDEDNVEVVVKVLDACTPFERFWVFAAGLTDVEVDLVVTDVETNEERRYPNPAGRPFPPIQDTDAFPTCP